MLGGVKPGRTAQRLSTVLVACLVSFASAQLCNVEIEPNDTPPTATPLMALGPDTGQRLDGSELPITCLAGELAGGGDQDAFEWTVDEMGARHSWTLEVEGVAGALTQVEIYRVELTDDGQAVTAADRLLAHATPDGSWSVSEPFLAAPGRYVIGVSGAGGRDGVAHEYVAYLRPRLLSARRSQLRADLTYEAGFDLYARQTTATDVPFTVDDEAAAFAWTLEVQAALGSSPQVSLEGPSGTVTRLEFTGPGPSSMANLGLEAGEYTLRVDPRGAPEAGPLRLALTSAGRISDGVEIEPNDRFEDATRFPLGSSMTGVAEGRDYFRVDVDAQQAGTTWTLALDAGAEVELWLYDANRVLLQERRGVRGESTGLALAEGHYYLELRGSGDAQYTLSLQPGAAPVEGDEQEPNDTVAAGTPLGPENQVRGDLAAQDRDVFQLTVTGEAQLYRLQVVGAGVTELALLDAAGQRVAFTTGERRIRLDDLTLLPGTHYLRVSGSGGEYALKALSLGAAPEPTPTVEAPPVDQPLEPATAVAGEQDADEALAEPEAAALPPLPAPPPGILELEPNDTRERAGRILPGVPHVGRLGSSDDRDFYRFYLPNDQYVRFEVVPAAGDPSIPYYLAGTWRQPIAGGAGEPVVVEQWLLAGSHEVELRGSAVGDGQATGYYQLRLTLLGPLHAPADFEPNDRLEQAAPAPAELEWSGLVGESRDSDYFLLPTLPTATTLSMTLTSDQDVYAEVSDYDRWLQSTGDGEEGTLTFDVPADTETYMRIRGSGRYHVALAYADAATGTAVTPPRSERHPAREAGDIDIAVDLDTDEIAAFWHEGQSFTGTVTVSNRGATDITVGLDLAAGDARVTVEGDGEVHVAAGQSATTPITVAVPADMSDSAPLAVQAAATSAADRAVAHSTVALRCEASPVGVFDHWPLPEQLLGMPNVLYSAFGAGLAGESSFEQRDRALIDGRTAVSYGGRVAPDHTPTYLLAGGDPVDLIGTTLHPQADSTVNDQLRGFSIETSLDGVMYTTAFEGELVAARFEQAFVFDKPVTARYARLVYGSRQADGGNGAYVGEWRLLATDPGIMSGLNLLTPQLGGHIVWSRPLLGDRTSLLEPDGSAGSVDLRDVDALTFVTSFHDGRAAMIDRIEWLEAGAQPRSDSFFEALVVEVSLSGPAGPWQPLGEWEFVRDASGLVRIELEESAWARFVKFTAPKPEGTRWVDLPSMVGVFEAPVTGGYLSALGEWGPASRRGPWEYFSTPQGAVEIELDADNDTMAGATSLRSGTPVTGTVAVTEDVDWYTFSVADGENAIEVRLEGDPSIGYVHQLLDANGDVVLHDLVEEGDSLLLTAFVEPGDYYLRFEEPKRSVVFSWDTSGSVGPYRPITYSSLAGFAREVDGDREAVQLLAFDDPAPLWVLPFWSSDPVRVQRSIAEFDTDSADSSNAEPALLAAASALAQRQGTKAVLFITDAESGGYGVTAELWEALEAARPRVFTFEISTSGSDYAQDLMQDWAAVNAGTYAMIDGVGEFDDGFARASCILRRPKRYTVEVTTSYVTPPGPETLTVTSTPGASRSAVEVIFDASGSMGRLLPSGESRIDAARGALESLISDALPDQTPFALRAFGHVAPSSCETRLDVKLEPLDRERALAAVRAIEPKLLSQTAIADSLQLAIDDLTSVTGPRTIILITDGAESCGGDPATAAAELRAAGDTSIAIVSLALEADDLAVFEDLAAEIGASYVDVGSLAALREAITAALVPVFEVYEAGGALVATGRVGESVELPMGLYRVRVLGAPVEVFENVRVPGDGSVVVRTGP